ncbi:MAG: prepilin-type N-terminal cleavage/methylation domain-containing protein [Gemmatimonadaceae bacterium]|nr:prepilin-type N-terminal cleavage/methylation domain-containing protein [Gemmatimonadaceae bacterium]MCW5825935.1 prepilin-type N-terminal cleavage/methylation domain-containing protein [Gemmatimonadaceae bacterium]
MRAVRLPARPGMTIIEVLFAIVILSGVMLALSQFGQGFTRATRNATNLTLASDLAAARLEAVRSHSRYATLVSTFNGTTETSATATANPSMQGYDPFTRATAAVRTQSDTTDYVTVTVSVSSYLLNTPIVKTTVITAF